MQQHRPQNVHGEPELPAYDTPQAYKPSLQFFGMTLMKTELNTPYNFNSGGRMWRPVFLELQSTQLNIYECDAPKDVKELIIKLFAYVNSTPRKDSEEKLKNDFENWLDHPTFLDGRVKQWNNGSTASNKNSKSQSSKNLRERKEKIQLRKLILAGYRQIKGNLLLFEPSAFEPDFMALGNTKGKLVHSYTLDNLAAGRALTSSDDTRISESLLVHYDNILRVRVELRQFLFQFWSMNALTQWLRNLSIGKDLAAPIEYRSVSTLKVTRGNSSGHEFYLSSLSETREKSPDFGYVSSSNETMTQSSESESDCSDELVFSRRSLTSLSFAEVPETVDICGYDFPRNNYYGMYTRDQLIKLIPNLNMYDEWFNKRLTLSNFENYLSKSQLKRLSEDSKTPIVIKSNDLEYRASKFKKAFEAGKSTNLRNCRTFMVFQEGLVSKRT